MSKKNKTHIPGIIEDFILRQGLEERKNFRNNKIDVDLKSNQIIVEWKEYQEFYYMAKSGKYLKDYFIRY